MKNAYGILVVFVVLSIIGGFMATRLSVQLNPSKSTGNITVNYGFANASPELIEQQVTSKLEGAFSMVQGVQKVSSVSGYNSGYITLEIDKKANLDEIRFEIATLVRQLYPKFPKEVSYPSISLNNPNQQDREKPLLTLQLNGNAQAYTLQQFAEEQLGPRLAQVEGVYNVKAFGGNQLEYVIRYDLPKIQALGISEQDILTAIQNQLSTKNLGTATMTGGKELRVKASPQLYPPQERSTVASPLLGGTRGVFLFSQILIKRRGDRLIYLKDIATVSREEQPATDFFRINGQNAINVVISADAGANQLKVVEELKRTLITIRQTFPPTYQVRIEYDATEYIRENLNQIAVQSGLAVLMLLIFVFITSRSWRYTALILVSMVVNLLLAAILFYVFKVEIHLYSLAALTTSLGIIIDNVIVMIDHYQRYKNLRVFTALLGATLTTCAGLVVLWFLPDEARYDLMDFAWVLVITLVVSLAVALFFIPAAMEQWKMNTVQSFKKKSRKKLASILKFGNFYERLLGLLLRFRKTTFVLAILAFGLPIFLLPNKVEETNPIAAWYNPVFGNEWYADNAKPILDKWLGGTLRLFVNYVYEGSYFSKPERTALYVVANLPNQSTIEQMDEVFQKFEKSFGQYLEIDRTITHVYNGQEGNMVIYFKPEAEAGSFPYILKNRAIALSTEMSGISWDIYGVGQGFSQNLGDNETPTFSVAMYGYNYNELAKQAEILKAKLEKHPRVQQVNTNKSPSMFGQKSLYEYVLQTDGQRMALQNISPKDLYQQLQSQNARPQPDHFAFINERYEPIKIIPVQSQHFDLWQLDNQPFKKDSISYKLKSFAKIERQKVTPEIHKENQQYIRLVSFEYFGSSRFGEKFLNETLDNFRPNLPLGYTVKRQDYNWWSSETRKQYELIGLVMVLIYVICAIIFESLRQPFALISLIPLSFIGVFLAFYWFDFNFDQGGYASFVLLSGNVVCAGIFLIAEYNTIRQRFPKKTQLECYLKAYQHKIIPILLTVLSTVLGLVPFLIYGQNETFWFALGIGTIGGLLMSLVVIFLVLPCMLIRN